MNFFFDPGDFFFDSAVLHLSLIDLLLFISYYGVLERRLCTMFFLHLLCIDLPLLSFVIFVFAGETPVHLAFLFHRGELARRSGARSTGTKGWCMSVGE